MTIVNTSNSEKLNIDEGIFERIANGDNDAFAELYYATYKQVYAFILSVLKNKYDAEDMLQETYLKVRAGAHLYRPEGKPLSWIFKIAHNLMKMKFRKDKQRVELSFDELDGAIGIEGVSQVENRMLIEKMFSLLSDEERYIIVMHVVSGLKHREIAELLGKPTSTILAKYNRAIRKIQIKVEEKEV